MLFADIVGLEEIKSKLIDGVNRDHVAHAQLFMGREGSANLPLALAYATYLNCVDRGEKDACGTCTSCTKMLKYIHPDFHFAFPVAGTKDVVAKNANSNAFLKDWRSFLLDNPFGNIKNWSQKFGGENKQPNISKEESRNIIRSLSLKAFEGNYKIMLIWLPEYMHPSSANAILKILEEPPSKTIFLLVTNDSERLLTTILSRTQIVKIPAFSDKELLSVVMNRFEVEEKKAQQIVHLADGNINQAFELSTEIEDDSHEMFREWMRLCYTFDFTNLVQWADNFQKLSKESQKSLLQYGLHMMRETMIAIASVDKILRLAGEELSFVQNFSKVMDVNKIERIVSGLNGAYRNLERNANPKILFLDLSLQIAQTIKSRQN